MAAPARVERDTKSIAVLPFTNLSSDPDQSFLADRIAEQIINLLSKHPHLRVVSRSSSFWFKGRDGDIPTVVSKLHVTHVLEGSVMKAGPKLRITAQLIDRPSDDQVWSGTYDRDLDDVFAIQDDIASSVAEHASIAQPRRSGASSRSARRSSGAWWPVENLCPRLRSSNDRRALQAHVRATLRRAAQLGIRLHTGNRKNLRERVAPLRDLATQGHGRCAVEDSSDGPAGG